MKNYSISLMYTGVWLDLTNPIQGFLKFNLFLKIYFGWEICCSEYTRILAYIHIMHIHIISAVGVGFELLPINHL